MVYIDNVNIKFGRYIMCHMLADTTKELKAMASKIGINSKYIQNPGSTYEHFDICISKKKLAIKYGAVEINIKKVYELLNKKRGYYL
jgi:hypothetical protein